MTGNDEQLRAAGWYPSPENPLDSGSRRYWDGQTWTNHLQRWDGAGSRDPTPRQSSRRGIYSVYFGAMVGWSLLNMAFGGPRWLFWLPLMLLSIWTVRRLGNLQSRELAWLTALTFAWLFLGEGLVYLGRDHLLGYWHATFQPGDGWRALACLGLVGVGYAALLLTNAAVRSAALADLRAAMQGNLATMAFRGLLVVLALFTFGRIFTGSLTHFELTHSYSYAFGHTRGELLERQLSAAGTPDNDPRGICGVDYATLSNTEHIQEGPYVDGCADGMKAAGG